MGSYRQETRISRQRGCAVCRNEKDRPVPFFRQYSRNRTKLIPLSGFLFWAVSGSTSVRICRNVEMSIIAVDDERED